MGVLRAIGIALIVIWLVLWLAVKVTVGTVHIIVVVGIALLLIGFLKGGGKR